MWTVRVAGDPGLFQKSRTMFVTRKSPLKESVGTKRNWFVFTSGKALNTISPFTMSFPSMEILIFVMSHSITDPLEATTKGGSILLCKLLLPPWLTKKVDPRQSIAVPTPSSPTPLEFEVLLSLKYDKQLHPTRARSTSPNWILYDLIFLECPAFLWMELV